jgi:hypothetical protein
MVYPIRFAVLGLLLVLVLVPVEGRVGDEGSSSSSLTGRVVGVSTTIESPSNDSSEEPLILPIAVHAVPSQSLSSISIAEKSSLVVLNRERASYQSARSRLANASASDQSLLRTELSIYRQRLLLALLNRLTLIYQRADLVVQKMEPSLLRMDILHDQRGGVSDYSTRYSALKSQLALLKSQSDAAARLLESCPTAVDLGACVRSSKDAVSSLLRDIPPYYSAYRSLAGPVLSGK